MDKATMYARATEYKQDRDRRQETPFFSIVTVVRNHAWALLRTIRSVFEQNYREFEYIIIDGNSNDGTQNLVGFWERQGLVTKAISEPDTGVYNAMNKGLQIASGKFVCFLNASDVFSTNDVLQRVHDRLCDRLLDGLLGWGMLNDQIWASWIESEAFKMASLGFCHQSLYVQRELLLESKFDERSFKTDSDTLQLGRLYEKGANIPIVREVFAVRGADPGISADRKRSAISIRNTLSEEYPELTDEDTEKILSFRRTCSNPRDILELLERSPPRLAHHLACMVLDTLFQRQSTSLDPGTCDLLVDLSLYRLISRNNEQASVNRLIMAQTHRASIMEECRKSRHDLDRAVAKFEEEEEQRISKLKLEMKLSPRPPPVGGGLIISLTSFPARLKTVSFAIRSLFEQTCPPKEIHLWLGRDEITGRKWLPKRLLALEELGLQIHFAERTFQHYDRFLHNAHLNATEPFVIVDDDVIYPHRALEYLLEAYQRYPEAVIGNRCHRIPIGREGVTAPYREWERDVHLPEPSFGLLPTGAGAVLYPPGFLSDPMVTGIDDILAHAPHADDLWLKICALAKSIPTYATVLSHKSDWYLRYTPTMQAGTLMTTNVDRGLNDVQIARCFEWLARKRPDWRNELRARENTA